MKKHISLILIIVLSLGLVSCGGRNDEDRPGGNYTGNPFARSQVSIVLDSYDDLLLAGEIRDRSIGHEDYYTFSGGIESYRPYYYFTLINAWITPTNDIEKFFSANRGVLLLDSYLFDTTGEKCSCGRHDLFVELSLLGNLKYEDVQNYPYVKISPAYTLHEIVEIEDASLLVMTRFYDYSSGAIEYKFSYNGTEVFGIYSCRELSESAITELLSKVVIWK